jgi:uncharacterized membrane protein
MKLPPALNTAKNVLQGKGFLSHPIHVAIVHFPLGLWEGGAVFDWMSQRSEWQKLSEAGYYANLLGIISAVPTALTGLAEWSDIPREHPAWKVATTHAVLNDAALGLALYNWWSRRNRRGHAPDRTNLIIDTALAGTLGISAWLGGLLVYDYGYGVHRQGAAIRKQDESLVGEHEHEGILVLQTSAGENPSARNDDVSFENLSDHSALS